MVFLTCAKISEILIRCLPDRRYVVDIDSNGDEIRHNQEKHCPGSARPDGDVSKTRARRRAAGSDETPGSWRARGEHPKVIEVAVAAI